MEDGIENVFERMDRMISHNPILCDITLGAGGSTTNLALDIAKSMQNIICIKTMIHLTCTNMLVEKINHVIETMKSNMIQNVLELHGDPPRGHDKFVQVIRGFDCTMDLVNHMRSKYGDYFGITVVGYPESHHNVTEANGIVSQKS